jgi:hypothetical protein
LKFAGLVAVGGLLTIGEALAQQPTIAETRLTNSIQRVSKTNTPPQLELPQALFLPNASQLTPLDEAYLDAFSILREDNTCSAFYGGPRAIEVLNQLKWQLKLTHLDCTVAVRMTGKVTEVISTRYLSYRLFDQAELNLSGPFYRGNALRSGRSMVPSIGSFLPNTREARVTILLHELGHLIEGPDKRWLLPNDGASAYLSEENTDRIIAVCGTQIRSRSAISFARELQVARLIPQLTTEEKPTATENSRVH